MIHTKARPNFDLDLKFGQDKENELQESITVVKIEFTDGKIFPAKLKDASKFKDGDLVIVSSVQDQQLRID